MDDQLGAAGLDNSHGFIVAEVIAWLPIDADQLVAFEQHLVGFTLAPRLRGEENNVPVSEEPTCETVACAEQIFRSAFLFRLLRIQTLLVFLASFSAKQATPESKEVTKEERLDASEHRFNKCRRGGYSMATA